MSDLETVLSQLAEGCYLEINCSKNGHWTIIRSNNKYDDMVVEKTLIEAVQNLITKIKEQG